MFLQILQTVGAILGIIAFVWKVRDLYQSYVAITLSVERDDLGHFSARVTVENRGLQAKAVSNALLLICPEHANPINVYNAILSDLGSTDRIRSLRGIAVNVVPSPIYSKIGTAVIPLPFFYTEQRTVLDECRTYRASIDITKLTEGIRYCVYFLLWGAGRIHRMTHDSFVVPKSSAG
jgi:hypothetical protein